MKNQIDPNAPYMEFAQRLVGLRTKADMTRKDLADITGISASTLFYYENGSRIPGADTAYKIARVFGITIEELLGVANPAADMEKANAIEDMGRLYGKHAAESAQAYLDGTNALLAGGALSEEEQQDFISVMRKILVDAEIRSKQKYTPIRFRTPTWRERTVSLRTQADSIIQSVDEEMRGRSGTSDTGNEDE